MTVIDLLVVLLGFVLIGVGMVMLVTTLAYDARQHNRDDRAIARRLAEIRREDMGHGR